MPQLSKQAFQLTIDDIHHKVKMQEKNIGLYRDEIESLNEEKLELKFYIRQEDSPYDNEAMERNIVRIDDNVDVFKEEIKRLELKRSEFYQMAATLEVKRDAAVS